MKILFINGSPNREGNTAALAETLLYHEPFCKALWIYVRRNGDEQKRGGETW